MHVTTNYMRVMVSMHVTLLLHECYMHVVRVLEMVVHVPQGWRKQIYIGQAKQNVGRRFCSKPENCLSLLNFLFNQYFIVDK